MKVLEYRFFVRDFSLEFYVGVVAVLFTALGVWVGLRLTRKKTAFVVMPSGRFVLNEAALKETGISPREHDVLDAMANGLSNQEIADKLFVSLNTVKTHTSNLFVKLDVKRRTQAIQKGKSMGLIP
ncbi:response regulator transcription factor [Chryseolinea sp. Jin1]|uniref:Response regulator transcription factor n=2 Tax=Chryseolinea lacunae TaxID=2801331 RepID=A0ABS1KLI7_9BACT|nr:response regulator transcription factor [Chryseolinea lacunae]MBL0740210.1 response regulator transcription factor [Chryseolinea lacunae]